MSTTTSRRSAGQGKRIRVQQRAAHLVTAALLIAYIYLPGPPDPILQAAIRWVVLPAVIITGLLMWQWPQLRRWARSRSPNS